VSKPYVSFHSSRLRQLMAAGGAGTIIFPPPCVCRTKIRNGTDESKNTIRGFTLGGREMMRAIGKFSIALLTLLAVAVMASAPAAAQQKPNIVVIWGDDIGQSDISAYSHGLMGFKTPNIDRIANEGVMFTDSTGVDLASFCKRSRPVLAPIHIAVPTSFRLGVAIPQPNQAHFQLDLS